MRYSFHFLLAMLLSTSLALSGRGLARAGTIRHDVNPQAYLNLGNSESLASVGKLTTLHSAGSRIATGTLIAPDVVLTAAHTLQNANTMSFLMDGFNYTASDWLAYPDWTGNLPAGYDLALVKLSAPVTSVTPAVRYRGSAEFGKIATLAGYGKTGTGLTGATSYDGLKRAGTNRIDSTSGGRGKDARVLWVDFDKPAARYSRHTAVTGASVLEYMPALGDSGSGMFLKTLQGMQLAGVNSFTYGSGSSIGSRYGDQAGYIRISAFNDWIDSVLRDWTAITPVVSLAQSGFGLQANGLDEPWTDDFLMPANMSVTPEPGSAMLACMATCILICFARRAKRT